VKLGSLANGNRDGCLVLVDDNLRKAIKVVNVVETMQEAIENWSQLEAELMDISLRLNRGLAADAMPFDSAKMKSPFPRAFQWLDGSAYVNHVELLRKARGVELPKKFWSDPLMYQGGSDHFLDPNEPILLIDQGWGADFEGELAVVVDDVPLGVTITEAKKHIKLIMLLNDISLRNLIPEELSKGFGFVHGKPPTAFAPVAVTPESLGCAWNEGKLEFTLFIYLNGKKVGWVNSGIDMTFSFPELVSHAAKTRPLRAGTIIGSGTISNADQKHGYSCLAEIRMIETIRYGEPKTAFLNFGDEIKIEMCDEEGNSVFGAIEQVVMRP
tara:strand:- start:275 stop:1255 length:981 start_codon:yes stop_codon:yes gene_type:complete